MYMFDLDQWYNRQVVLPIVALIEASVQIKHVHFSVSYQQAIYQRYDWCLCESPSGYGA